MNLCVVLDLLEHAEKKEKENKKWGEWLAFSPVLALDGTYISFQEFCKTKPRSAAKGATDADIKKVRDHFKL